MPNDLASFSSTDSPARRTFAVIKRSVVIGGHKTSISLEDAFWSGLKDIALRRSLTLSSLIETIDQHRQTDNLSSAVRLFVLDYFRVRATSPVMIGERQVSRAPTPASA